MQQEKRSRDTIFGYLSTVITPQHGYFGGYLIISLLGRPLEFHCSSPVLPSRAHEILYGPTLQPFLLGEQIGGALLDAAKLTPNLILTDYAAMLAIRSRVAFPVALLPRSIQGGTTSLATEIESNLAVNEVQAPVASCEQLLFSTADDLQLPIGYEVDRPLISQLVKLLVQHVEIAEPFGRIHEAIREAQRIGGRTLETHGQAA
jgi:hypothetical protein